MIPKELLQSFCEPKGTTRPALSDPFNCDGYTFATDGHICIRVDVDNSVESHPEAPKTMKGIFLTCDDDSKYIDIPEIEGISLVVGCPVCGGSGKLSVCPECEGNGEVFFENDYNEYECTCESCFGTGKYKSGNIAKSDCEECYGTGKITKDIGIDIGTRHITARLLCLIKNLPNVKIAPEATDRLNPIQFKFDGGCGILMPRRRENGEI